MIERFLKKIVDQIRLPWDKSHMPLLPSKNNFVCPSSTHKVGQNSGKSVSGQTDSLSSRSEQQCSQSLIADWFRFREVITASRHTLGSGLFISQNPSPARAGAHSLRSLILASFFPSSDFRAGTHFIPTAIVRVSIPGQKSPGHHWAVPSGHGRVRPSRRLSMCNRLGLLMRQSFTAPIGNNPNTPPIESTTWLRSMCLKET